MENTEKLKQIGLFSLIAFCIGDTIGAGIFSSLPYAVSLVGPGIMWCWIVAVIMTILVNIPSIIPSASLPCPSAGYTITSKLLSPYLGFFELISMMNYVIILGLLAIFFSDYVNMLLPGVPSLAVSLGVIIVFWIINLLGVDSSTTIQNIIVVILVFTLLSFIVTGGPNVSSEYVTASQILLPTGMSFTAFCACLALCYNCLGGCFTGCLVFGDRVTNPHRNLILGGCLTALIVGFLYSAISIITCGLTDWTAELPPLGNIAKLFMPQALWVVFIIGGALGAMASTINAMFSSVGYRFDTMAEDGIFPAIFNKTNRFGVKPLCISIAPIIGIILVLLDPPLNAMMSACAVLAILGGILRLWPLVVLEERYPHTYKRAIIPLSKPARWIWVVASTVVCVVVSISTIVETTGGIWIVIFGILAIMYFYFIVRIKYMKSKNIDIYANMSAPYKEWEDAEEAYRIQDEGAK